jgi:hypothetical protein
MYATWDRRVNGVQISMSTAFLLMAQYSGKAIIPLDNAIIPLDDLCR